MLIAQSLLLVCLSERPPHQPKSPSHVSPVPESEAAKRMRRWKNEMSLPSPISSTSTLDVAPGRLSELPDQGKHGDFAHRGSSSTTTTKELKQQPEKILKESPKTKEMDKDKSLFMTVQSRLSEGPVDQQLSSAGIASNVQSSIASTPYYSQATSFGGKVSHTQFSSIKKPSKP